LNTPLFLARKIGPAKQGKTFTGLIRKISVLSITLGLAVMILAVAVVTGFQEAIRDKVIGFGAHIQVTNFHQSATHEFSPIQRDENLIDSIKRLPGIRHVQEFASKTGIIKTDEDIHGVVMKGIGPDFDWSFFKPRMTAGKGLDFSDSAATNQVIISQYISDRLSLEVGEYFILYFIQEPPALRRLQVAGVYETGLEELDRIFILGDIKHIQRLNRWEPDQIGGYEILVNDFNQLDMVAGKVFNTVPYYLNARSIREIYPQIFDWLALLDMNVYVILFLMVLVAGINMITTLLVAILEKTSMVGILKAVGASNRLVKRVFLYNAAFVILKGLFWGNVLGLTVSLIQHHLGIMTLPQDSYYVSVVPINLELIHILGLNAGTFAICIIMLIGPSMIVTRVSPVKAIVFR
jgi:lipoprotein-releasing system permease protein